MEADRALAVVTQPDVRVRRLLAIIPRHVQSASGRVQLRPRDRHRGQTRVLVRRRLTEQQ